MNRFFISILVMLSFLFAQEVTSLSQRIARSEYNITPEMLATVSNKLKTLKGQWILFNLEVNNQNGDLVATGESMAEVP